MGNNSSHTSGAPDHAQPFALEPVLQTVASAIEQLRAKASAGCTFENHHMRVVGRRVGAADEDRYHKAVAYTSDVVPAGAGSAGSAMRERIMYRVEFMDTSGHVVFMAASSANGSIHDQIAYAEQQSGMGPAEAAGVDEDRPTRLSERDPRAPGGPDPQGEHTGRVQLETVHARPVGREAAHSGGAPDDGQGQVGQGLGRPHPASGHRHQPELEAPGREDRDGLAAAAGAQPAPRRPDQPPPGVLRPAKRVGSHRRPCRAPRALGFGRDLLFGPAPIKHLSNSALRPRGTDFC